MTNPARPTGRMTTAKWLALLVSAVPSAFWAGVYVTRNDDSLDACREREGACYERLDRCYDKDAIAGMRDDWTAAVRRAEDAAE